MSCLSLYRRGGRQLKESEPQVFLSGLLTLGESGNHFCAYSNS